MTNDEACRALQAEFGRNAFWRGLARSGPMAWHAWATGRMSGPLFSTTVYEGERKACVIVNRFDTRER